MQHTQIDDDKKPLLKKRFLNQIYELIRLHRFKTSDFSLEIDDESLLINYRDLYFIRLTCGWQSYYIRIKGMDEAFSTQAIEYILSWRSYKLSVEDFENKIVEPEIHKHFNKWLKEIRNE